MWSDRETQHDCLGFTSYVNVLADICTLTDLAPLTLGIFGTWGSGKTSLMRMLKHRIEETVGKDGVKTLWFNAWRYEGREEAQSALIHAILARLSEDETLLENAKEVLGRLTKGASVLKLAKFIGKTAVTLTPDLNGFIDCFKEESRQIAETMEQFEKDFGECLDRMKVKHIVVFIDDLDRCSSEKVIETFETIKLFLNTPQCTFVIGADAAKIEDAVGEVYRVEDQRRRKDYLEKIVQVPFTIPPQSVKDIACYIGMLVMQRHIDPARISELLQARCTFYHCESNAADAICQWPSDNAILFGDKITSVRDELKEVLPYVEVLAHGLQGNPRQIKRFLNIVGLRRRLAKENDLDVRSDLLIKLAVLEYSWEDFFTALIETTDPATGQSELIVEVVAAAQSEDGTTSKSKLVTESLGRTGLVEYLLDEPRLTGDLDLNPYLFLAQTALSRGRPLALLPVDEKAQSLARSIESDDPLRTKTAAKRTAAEEPAVVGSAVRILLADLPQAQPAIQTHILNGLDIICRKHTEQYTASIKAFAQLDATGHDAVALAASTFLANAQKAGVLLPDGLQEKFMKDSKIASALVGSKKKTQR